MTGHFIESDGDVEPLLRAIGRAVWGIGGLEKSLLLEYARLAVERDGLSPELGEELTRLEGLPSGAVLNEVRKFDLPGDLDGRISDAIARRNRLLHHQFEDPELVRAVVSGEGIDAVVERVNRLALDCGELAVELYVVASPRLEAALGMSRGEIVEALKSIDPEAVADPVERQQFEAILALGEVDLDDLGLP